MGLGGILLFFKGVGKIPGLVEVREGVLLNLVVGLLLVLLKLSSWILANEYACAIVEGLNILTRLLNSSFNPVMKQLKVYSGESCNLLMILSNSS